MAANTHWLMLLLIVGLAWRIYPWRRQQQPQSQQAAVQRRLKLRTPDNCPGCCQPAAFPQAQPQQPVRPWREVKGRRGAPKRIHTHGFACPPPHLPAVGADAAPTWLREVPAVRAHSAAQLEDQLSARR